MSAEPRLWALLPTLALALPAPAEATIRAAACGRAAPIEIPLHRKDRHGDPCMIACHADRPRRPSGRR
ncbi:MAG: hypothetical protein WDN24_14870 [Sphingomonas sp.]